MRVLVTGAAGYVATAVAKRVHGLVDLTLTDVIIPENRHGRWLRLDVTDLGAVCEAVRGHDIVVHTVALVRGRQNAQLGDFVRVMVEGTWNVAEACASEGVSRLVNVSSVIADGWPSSTQQRRQIGDPPVFHPLDRFYAISKHLGEHIVDAYGRAFNLNVVNLRPGVIAGDGVNSGPARTPGDGPFWFVYVDVADVAQAVERCLQPVPPKGGTYYIVAARPDALFDPQSAMDDIGYAPANLWPGI